MSKQTFTATFAGATAEITTSRKIAWATFVLYNGQWKLATDGFSAAKLSTVERNARAIIAINYGRGFINYEVVPAVLASN